MSVILQILAYRNPLCWSHRFFKFYKQDLFFIEHGRLYNYADDNNLSYANQVYNTLMNFLEKESSILIEWFKY
jgi:hypothetical protein